MKTPIPGRTTEVADKKPPSTLFESNTQRVGELFSLGYSIEDISDKTGLSVLQVRNRVSILSKKWQDDVSKVLEYHVGREVAASDWIIKKALDMDEVGLDNLVVALRGMQHRASVLGLSKRMGDKKPNGHNPIKELLEIIQDSREGEISSAWSEEK